ncbi:Rieske 2Fe-2S domain-containing protein [Paracoccus sp. KR1-242]|uniref:Rieske 2Fe-2S domain-containing protein n=1 Tax=Paracoccus sp. KR1-242 TaxID=3410028 RepID=UPI003C003FAE
MPNWVPAALSADLSIATAMPAKTPLGELAIWRGGSGRVSAFHDRCPHRGMRLSHGFVRGEMLSCIYHGWRYDGTGQCRKIPAHPDLVPPAAVRAGRLACVEQGGLIWVAAEGTETAPPEVGDVLPLRSIAVERPIAEVAAALGIDGLMGKVSLPGCKEALTLALLDAQGRTVLHALMPEADAATRIAASRALEALRRGLETETTEAAQ